MKHPQHLACSCQGVQTSPTGTLPSSTPHSTHSTTQAVTITARTHTYNFIGFRCYISCACRALCNRLSTTGRQSSHLRPATSPQVQRRRSSRTGISLICHSQLLHARLKSAALITLFVGDSRLVCLTARRMRRGECFCCSRKTRPCAAALGGA